MAAENNKWSRALIFIVGILVFAIGRAISAEYPAFSLIVLMYGASSWFGIWLAKKSIEKRRPLGEKKDNGVSPQSTEISETEQVAPVSLVGESKRDIVEAGFRKQYGTDFMSDESYESLSDHKAEALYNEGLKLKQLNNSGDPNTVTASHSSRADEHDELLKAKMEIIRIGFKRINNISPSDDDLRKLPERALKHYYDIGLKQLAK